MKLLFIVVPGLVALAGCETIKPAEHGSVIETTVKADGSKVIVENRSDYANYTNTKFELAKKPLFSMECPAEGCRFAKLEVANPNAGADIKEPAPPPKQESVAVGVAREIKETLGILAPVGMAATVGHTVNRIFASFGGTVTQMATTIQAPQPNVTTTNVANTTNTTTNTNSGNTSNTANTNSGNTTSTTVSNTGATGTARVGP